jgi:hypothetical protein
MAKKAENDMALETLDKKKDEDQDQLDQPDLAAPLRADILGSMVKANPATPGYLGTLDKLITAHGAVEDMGGGTMGGTPKMGGPSHESLPMSRPAPDTSPEPPPVNKTLVSYGREDLVKLVKDKNTPYTDRLAYIRELRRNPGPVPKDVIDDLSRYMTEPSARMRIYGGPRTVTR